MKPGIMQVVLRQMIDSVIDVGAFNQELDAEKGDAVKLDGLRKAALETFGDFEL